MQRQARPYLFGLVRVLAAAIAAGACSDSNDTPHVSVATNLTLPRGVLDRVSKLTLTVLEGSVTCDATMGQTTLPMGADAAKEIARRELASAGCAPGVKFCGDVAIEKSD